MKFFRLFPAVLSLTFVSSCVSKRADLASQFDVKVDANSKRLIKSYEVRPSLDERLSVLSPRIATVPDQSAIRPSVSIDSPAIAANAQVGDVTAEAWGLLLRTEQWQELINETSALWSQCLAGRLSQGFDEGRCRAVGHARAVAFSRLGHLKDALAIQDFLSHRSLNSLDALLFANVLVDHGSPGLCAQLARAGLQWQPPENRLELFALQAKCLRLNGQNEMARNSINVGLTEYPDASALLFESALLFLSEKNLTQGCNLLERLYVRDFRDVAVSYHWGNCLVGRRDAATARDVLAKARQQWPSERLWILLSGEVLFLEGDLIGARRDGLDYLASATQGDLFRPAAERLIRNAQGE